MTSLKVMICLAPPTKYTIAIIVITTNLRILHIANNKSITTMYITINTIIVQIFLNSLNKVVVMERPTHLEVPQK